MPTRLSAFPLVAVLALALGVAVTVGCASTLQPRTSAELPYKDYKKIGAVMDASRAYPVAFYAEPTQKPVQMRVEFGLPAANVMAAQWLTHTAARMNQALHEVGLYDRRFASFAHQVFHNRLSAGTYVYDFKGDGTVKRYVEVSGARLVKMKVVSFKPVKSGAQEMVRLTVEITIGGLPRLYQADSAGARWDRGCFDAIARKILGDPAFWKVVSQSP